VGAAAAPAPEFLDPAFGPRYVIEEIVLRGNRRTQDSLILAELGLRAGDAVVASDPRVETARFRLLALGHFLDARLSVERGKRRGGVVLLVEVEERGTLVINELYPSTSSATAFWGGADVSDTNFLGRGVNLGAGFVASTKPLVLNSEKGLGLRLHGSIPERQGPRGLGLSATALYNDGSEFIAIPAGTTTADPGHFTAANLRRAGGIVGVSKTLTRALRASIDLRGEAVNARLPPLRARTFPDGATAPIDFGVREGASRVATLALTLDYDTRSDPVLPRAGARVVGTVEAGGRVFGGDYGFGKALVQASFYLKMPRGHALGFHLLGGAILGDAPIFDRFFIGDLNLLLARRALGMSFSTLPSRNLLGTSIARQSLRRLRGARPRRVRDPRVAAPRLRLRRRRLRGRRSARNGERRRPLAAGGPDLARAARRPDGRSRAAPRHLRGHLHDLDRQRSLPQLLLMNARHPAARVAVALFAALVASPRARAAGEDAPRRTTGLALTPGSSP